MRKQLKMCVIIAIVFAFVVLCFVGCDSETGLEGYWVSGDEKYSVSFDGKGTIVVDDKYIGEYIVFDENKIAINVDTTAFDKYLDLSMSATYNIIDETLIITDKDKDEEFVFYTKEKVDEIINRAYQEKTDKFNGVTEILFYETLGYFDDNGNLIKNYDWIIEEDEKLLYDYLDEVQEIFNKEVLNYYQTKSPEGKYHILNDGLLGVDGTILYGIELRREGEGTLSIVNRYAIEPVEGIIYIEDFVYSSYELWDGIIAYGRSLLDD